MLKDPKKVLIPIEDMEWNPEKPVSEAIKIAEQALLAPVDNIDFNINLTGAFASKFHFIKTLLSSLGMPDNEIDLYILQSGVEAQFNKLKESISRSE